MEPRRPPRRRHRRLRDRPHRRPPANGRPHPARSVTRCVEGAADGAFGITGWTVLTVGLPALGVQGVGFARPASTAPIIGPDGTVLPGSIAVLADEWFDVLDAPRKRSILSKAQATTLTSISREDSRH